ncbi:hypothetical protein [Paenibacillus illinoisensis]|uniref:hypothetical protein n=1 Tax=Paenibacillus illinoisensis TaxID=59845 RepID=UPI00301E2F11
MKTSNVIRIRTLVGTILAAVPLALFIWTLFNYDIRIVIAITFFILISVLFFMVPNTRELVDEEESELETKYVIHFFSDSRDIDQHGRFQLTSKTGYSGKEIWFHQSISDVKLDPCEKSFFRNHIQWRKLSSYKVSIPWSELRRAVKEESGSIHVRPSDGSIVVKGIDNIMVNHTIVEKEFYWYHDRIALKYVLRYLFVYISGILHILLFPIHFGIRIIILSINRLKKRYIKL